MATLNFEQLVQNVRAADYTRHFFFFELFIQKAAKQTGLMETEALRHFQSEMLEAWNNAGQNPEQGPAIFADLLYAYTGLDLEVFEALAMAYTKNQLVDLAFNEGMVPYLKARWYGDVFGKDRQKFAEALEELETSYPDTFFNFKGRWYAAVKIKNDDPVRALELYLQIEREGILADYPAQQRLNLITTIELLGRLGFYEEVLKRSTQFRQVYKVPLGDHRALLYWETLSVWRLGKKDLLLALLDQPDGTTPDDPFNREKIRRAALGLSPENTIYRPVQIP